MAHRLTTATIDDEAALRDVIGGDALATTRAKISDRLNPLTRQYIERSPFACIATADDAGVCDVSPRGDPAGFVRILDDQTLLVPERPGNRLADTLRNLLRNPRLALWFLIPGMGDTLRVNGRGTITNDRALLEPSAVEGKLPKLGILVDIEAAFTQCPKAILRAQLWDPARFDLRPLPSLGEILALQDSSIDGEAYNVARAERYARRDGFY